MAGRYLVWSQKNKSVVSICIIAVLFAGLFLVSVSTVKPSGRQTRLQSVKQSTVGEGDFTNILQKAAELTLETVTCDTQMAQAKNNFSVSAEFKDGKIVLLDMAENTELASIEEKYDEGSLFVGMKDENNGYAPYCSTPGAGMMEKLLYVTNDRWKTYRETAISSQIDGCPTSISVLPDGQGNPLVYLKTGNEIFI